MRVTQNKLTKWLMTFGCLVQPVCRAGKTKLSRATQVFLSCQNQSCSRLMHLAVLDKRGAISEA